MSERGFSIIELLVAITIFSLIVGSTTGLFISAVRAQAKILATQKLLDEASYAMEYMGRFLRMAKKDGTGDCVKACDVPPVPGYNYNIYAADPTVPFWIRFIDYYGKCHQFGLDQTGTPMQMAEWVVDPPYTACCGVGTICTDFDGASTPNNFLTSEDFTIPLTPLPRPFSIYGESEADSSQPRVTYTLHLQKYPEEKPDIAIQTTISQRDLDLR